MFLVGLVSWWYGKGWQRYVKSLISHLARTADFFSIGILFSTLFAPFRQISAGRVNGALGDVMRGFFDKLISRIIGAMIRSVVLVFGLIVIVLQAVVSLVLIIFWGLVPIIPIAGLILMASGWTPAWQ